MDILDIMNLGAANVFAHDESNRLRTSAEQFLHAYRKFDGYNVVAASPQAERVLGAAMILRPAMRVGGRGATVILDVNIASGTLIACVARRLRDAGNQDRLVGIALHSLVEDVGDWTIAELSELVVADSDDQGFASLLGERTESGGRRVALAR